MMMTLRMVEMIYRQRGGIGFVAHIEPLMIHDTHEDDNDEYDGGKNSNLRLGENMVTPFVTIFVTKMVTLVTMLTMLMVTMLTMVERRRHW